MLELFESKKDINDPLDIQSNKIGLEIFINKYKIELPTFSEIKKSIKTNAKDIIIKNTSESIGLSEIARQHLKDLSKYETELNTEDKYNYHLASLFSIIGDYQKENEYLSKIANIENNIFYYEKLGENIMRQNPDKGISILSSINTPDAVISIALFKLQINEFNEAIDLVSSYISNNEYNYKMFSMYALLKLLEGDSKTVIGTVRNILLHDKIDDNLCFFLSLSYFYQKNYNKSTYWSRIGLNLNPANRDLLRLCFSIYSLDSKYLDCDIMGKYFENYNSFKDDDIIINECLAYFYYLNKEYEHAIIIINKLLASDDKNSSYWNNLAILNSKNGNNKKALSNYLVAIKTLKTENITLFANVLKYFYDEHQYTELIDIYKSLQMSRTVTLDFNNYLNVHFYYLKSLLHLLKLEEYLKLINEIKAFTDSNTDVEFKIYILNELISFYSRQNYNVLELWKYGRELRDTLSSNPNVDNKMGILNNIIYSYLETNNSYSDKKTFQYFCSNLADNPIYNATYGLYCIKSGNLGKGIEYYEKALTFAIDNELRTALKQKRDLETGKFYLAHNDKRKAMFYFDKVKKNNTVETYYYSNQVDLFQNNIVQ